MVKESVSARQGRIELTQNLARLTPAVGSDTAGMPPISAGWRSPWKKM
jgi:hypothetical protein